MNGDTHGGDPLGVDIHLRVTHKGESHDVRDVPRRTEIQGDLNVASTTALISRRPSKGPGYFATASQQATNVPRMTPEDTRP